jgi:hypothetical protein
LLDFNWTHSAAITWHLETFAGTCYVKQRDTQPDNLADILQGNQANTPLSIKKIIDKTSPFWFQATTDFDPYGNSWTYSFVPGARPCPHLFSLNFTIPLDSFYLTGRSLQVIVLDAVPIRIKVTMPGTNKTLLLFWIV